MNFRSKQERPRLYKRLVSKIILAISLSVLVIQLGFVRYIDKRIYDIELSKLVDQQTSFTEANAIYIAEMASENQEDNIYLILSSIVANPIIQRASFEYSDSGDVISVGQEATSLDYSFAIKDLDENDDLITVGHLITHATTGFIDQSRDVWHNSILALVLAVFLVVLAVSALAVQYFVGLPLVRIMRAIEDDKKVTNIQWHSKDEMGTVVTRLNYLHTRLSDKLSGLEHELGESERREAERISSLANASLESILIFEENQIIDLNSPTLKLFGSHSREALLESPVSELFDDTVLEFLQQPLSDDGVPPVIKTRLRSENGKDTPVEIYLNKLEKHAEGRKVAIIRDISEREAAEQAMWKLAHLDSLTGLPNRRYFTEKLDLAVQMAKHKGSKLSVAYLDLDKFKFINDSRGHTVGDQLLCAIAESLKYSLGTENRCARIGGDEFVMLLEHDSLEAPFEVTLDNVFNEIINGSHCEQWRSIFSVSIGAATMEGPEINKDELLMRADLSLNKAKQSGRARICHYSEQLDARLKRERLISEKLPGALEQDQLELHYQAQALCDGLCIVGFEALLRWYDDELGRVSPEEIIDVAEREGLVSEVGRWVIRRACLEACNWPSHIRLAVNLSPLELTDRALPEFVAKCLASSGLHASRLEVEMTETVLVSDSSEAAKQISKLKEMGVMVALDDFGTGYSSLSMLQQLPFDRIKIDRSFVSDLSEDENKASIVASIIDLGARLDLDVIAEGVESETDVAKLLSLNCLEVQGYYLSKPIPPSELPELIENSPMPDTSLSTLIPFKKTG